MALYGEDLANFLSILGQIKPYRERLQTQNNALGATITTLAGFAAQLQAWADAGDVDPGHLGALAASVQQAIEPATIAQMIAGISSISGLSPALVLCTDDNGDGSSFTPVPLS